MVTETFDPERCKNEIEEYKNAILIFEKIDDYKNMLPRLEAKLKAYNTLKEVGREEFARAAIELQDKLYAPIWFHVQKLNYEKAAKARDEGKHIYANLATIIQNHILEHPQLYPECSKYYNNVQKEEDNKQQE
ncbi:MAG: hypothetical protein ACP5N2_03160 [Candidatus Nanoarchaeia archaeon]